ncbi:MAG: calcium-transporting P-type ATPase, PMR1-type [Chloroflexi bacterium]|nr:calcium-transporting P-type ATPase, PMR1-type [Chloroflexota bacterium]
MKGRETAMFSNDRWHARSVEDVLRTLGTGRTGLSVEEASRRLQETGPNELRREAVASPLVLFLHQFKDFLMVILLVATAVSALLGEVLDAAVIFAIVVLSALLGFFQEYRASRALEALKRMAAPEADVVRDGQEQKVLAREVVTGDIVLLATGDRVPADGRIVEDYNLKVDESAFTGESEPVMKQSEPLAGETPLPERTDMAYAGTTVIAGRGAAVVVATGMQSEFGKIAHLVQIEDGRHSPLEQRMAEIGRRLGMGAIAIVAVVVLAGLGRGEHPLDMFLWGVSLAVAAVPEALPAVVTGALTIGVQRMARRQAIVRRLPAVETLGSTTVICSDKTGTLTKNEMTVRRLWLGEQTLEVTGIGYEPRGDIIGPIETDRSDIATLARIAALCNDAHLLRNEKGRHYVLGDPTEGALLVLAAKAGFEPEPLRLEYPRVEEIPFDSVRKRMTTIHQMPEGAGLVCAKGAPEVILSRCSLFLKSGKPAPLTPDVRRRIVENNENMASQALRLLALAYREIESPTVEATEETAEKDLVFVATTGMVDPPREEVKAALRLAQQAGVRTVMVTGDHRLTAVAVARELGWQQDGEMALTGADLDRIADEQFPSVAERVGVYARTSPEHKLRLVSALQSKGQIVAMTGDGINDAPALRRADIGVAMGLAGTDVTKEAADMVLSDDNYATIVAAIEEGRVIYDNIRKFIRYLLSTNSGELLTVFVAVIAGLPMPLLAIQILWINLVTDGLPALALGVEPAEPGVMRRPPRPPHESIFARGLWQHIIWVGLMMAAGSLAVMVWGLANYSLETTRTMVFLTLASFQMFHVLAIRSERESVFKVGFFSNPYLTGGVALAFALQLAITYLPLLQATFSTTSLDILQLGVCLGVSHSIFWAVEAEKWLWHHRPRR